MTSTSRHGGYDDGSPTAVFRRTLHLPTLTPPLRLTLLGADSSSSINFSSSTSRVWSSTHPLPRHLPYLTQLRLKTLLALSPKHPFEELPALQSWAELQQVKVHWIQVPKWKESGPSSLTRPMVEEALTHLVDVQASPLLVIATAPQLLAAVLGILRLVQGHSLEPATSGILPEMGRALRIGLEGEAEEDDRVACEKWVKGWVGKEMSLGVRASSVHEWVWPAGTALSLLRQPIRNRGASHTSGARAASPNGEQGQEAAASSSHGVPRAPHRASTLAAPSMAGPSSSPASPPPPLVVHPFLKLKFLPEDEGAEATTMHMSPATASQIEKNEGDVSLAADEGQTDTRAPSSSQSITAATTETGPLPIPRAPPPTSTASASTSGPSSAPSSSASSPDSSNAPLPPASGRRTHGRKRSLTISEGRSAAGSAAEAHAGLMTEAAAAAAITCSGIDIDGGGAARGLRLGSTQAENGATESPDLEMGQCLRPTSLPASKTSPAARKGGPFGGPSNSFTFGGRDPRCSAPDRRPDLAFLDVARPPLASGPPGGHADEELDEEGFPLPRTPTQMNRSPSGGSPRPDHRRDARRGSGDGGLGSQDMTPTASRTTSAAQSTENVPASAATALWRRRRRSSGTTGVAASNTPSPLTTSAVKQEEEPSNATSSGSTLGQPATPRPSLARNGPSPNRTATVAQLGSETGENEDEEDERHLTPKAQARANPLSADAVPPQSGAALQEESMRKGENDSEANEPHLRGQGSKALASPMLCHEDDASRKADQHTVPGTTSQCVAQRSLQGVEDGTEGEEGDATIRADPLAPGRVRSSQRQAGQGEASTRTATLAAATAPSMLDATRARQAAGQEETREVEDDDEDEEQDEEEEEDEDEDEDEEDSSHPISAGLEALDLA